MRQASSIAMEEGLGFVFTFPPLPPSPSSLSVHKISVLVPLGKSITSFLSAAS